MFADRLENVTPISIAECTRTRLSPMRSDYRYTYGWAQGRPVKGEKVPRSFTARIYAKVKTVLRYAHASRIPARGSRACG